MQRADVTAIEMRPDTAIEQDIAAKKNAVGLIQEANMVRRFARRVQHLQTHAADLHDIAMLQPPRHFERWQRRLLALKAARPWRCHDLFVEKLPEQSLLRRASTRSRVRARMIEHY